MTKKILFVVAGAVLLSGCTLPIPGSNKSAPAGIGSIWKTEDGGKTFSVKSKIDDKTRISKADILSIAYHPQKPLIIYVGSVENGIFKTENGGEQWTPIAFPPRKIYSFILDRNDPDNRMFASGMVGDWGRIFRTDDGGKNWRDVYTEPGQKVSITALAQHPRDTNVILAGTAAGTVVKSVDSGETWKNVGNKISGIVADIAYDSTKSLSSYLLVFDEKIYYSPDGGVQWLDWEEEKKKEISDLRDRASDLAKKDDDKGAERLRKQASALSERNQKNKMPGDIISMMSDPVRSGVLYAGTNSGFFRSVDFGKYWDEINIIESAKKFPIRSIAINPKESKEIVFVAGKAFYKSTDSGETWMTTGLNVDRGASFVTYDPFDSRYLFIGLRNFK